MLHSDMSNLPHMPQPSHWFPVLASGEFTMAIKKHGSKNRTGKNESRSRGDEVIFAGYGTVGFLKGSYFKLWSMVLILLLISVFILSLLHSKILFYSSFKSVILNVILLLSLSS